MLRHFAQTITKAVAIFALLASTASAPVNAQAPKELKVACGSVGIELQLCSDAVARWSKKTGFPASIVSMPAQTSERLALYQQFLSAKLGEIDVFQIDVVWPGILKNHLLDLTPFVPQEEIDQHFTSITQNNTVDDKLLAMPLYTDVGVMFYRKDLLEKYKLKEPTTWDQLEHAAKVIQEGERKDGISDFWGFVWQGKAYEGLTCNALEWVNSQGGGAIVAPEGAITIVNEHAAKALDRAAGWVGTISPKGVLNYGEEEARGVFQSGKAAFMRNWPYAWSLAQGDGSPIKDKVGMIAIPSAGKGSPRSGTLGGWQMAVSKYSEQPERAADLVRYMTGPEVQKDYAVRAAYNPTIRDLYKDPKVLAGLPVPDVMFKALSEAVARPSRVTGFRYNYVSNSFWNAAHATLSHDGDGKTNLEALEHRLKRISKEGKWQ